MCVHTSSRYTHARTRLCTARVAQGLDHAAAVSCSKAPAQTLSSPLGTPASGVVCGKRQVCVRRVHVWRCVMIHTHTHAHTHSSVSVHLHITRLSPPRSLSAHACHAAHRCARLERACECMCALCACAACAVSARVETEAAELEEHRH